MLRGPKPAIEVEFFGRGRDRQIPGGRAGDDVGRAGDLVGQGSEFLQQRRDGAGKIMVTPGKADLDTLHVSDEAIADDLRRMAKHGKRALPRACLPDDVVLLHRFDDSLLLADGAGERFFAVDVFLAIGGRRGKQGMPLVRNGDHDGVDVVAGDHFADNRGRLCSPGCRSGC